MARAGARHARPEAARAQDLIRSIYAARSAASSEKTTGDFARMRSADPDRSLRAAYLSHLSRPKDEAPRKPSGVGESALRRAYIARSR